MDLDFRHADFTAVISDLHLCEENIVNPKFPLWKKYKTKEFFFDDVFSDFLDKIHEMSRGKPIELILNGDIFDFDSVMNIPEAPPFRLTKMEVHRGMHPQEEKSAIKMATILSTHTVWVSALKSFLNRGHRAVFIIGNHDLELHFPEVQEILLKKICSSFQQRDQVRFTEWFYISNQDTLIEHGNQYDPYCRCEDPVNPFVQCHGAKEVRLPFGSWATRYIINGMGFFNPHVDSNFIMSFWQYIRFFFRYMVRAQPLIVWTWLSGSFMALVQTIGDQLRPALRDPLTFEERIEDIARRSNATPGMTRQLSELFIPSAARSPWLIARELWLDRALILLGTFYLLFNLYLLIHSIIPISIVWFLLPSILFLPPLIFYSSFVDSDVIRFKEPQERVLTLTSLITKVHRVVYGHTHIVRHEIIGAVEHLNSGCWSPAFVDVECRQPIDQKTFVWIFREGESDSPRKAQLLKFQDGAALPLFSRLNKRAQNPQ